MAIVLLVAMAVFLAGCGGGDSGPAEMAGQSGVEATVEPSAGPDPGDMDSDGSPTKTDAEMIMEIVVDPDGYDGTVEYYANCETSDHPTQVNIGDALKVLRAVTGEETWPFPSGGPPPPPPPPGPEDQPPPPPPI